MFDEVIRASYSNSSNLRGDALDGNWVFLLPNLHLKRVLCIGEPSPQTLATLTSLAEDVVRADSAGGGTFDLIYVAGNKRASDFAVLARALSSRGYVYYEDRGNSQITAPDNLQLLQSLWLTPTFGNMQTAVPLGDRATIDYFNRTGLYTPSVTQHTFNDLQRRWLKRKTKPVNGQPSEPSDSPAKSGGRGWKKSFRTGLRKFRNAATTVAPALENIVTRNRVLKPLLDRRGVLLTNDHQAAAHRLPEYLRHIALDDNVDLSAFRWGYAARGRYRSQKLLYFLFQPMSSKPVYIIKMVRDAVFNTRLEREHSGLLLLQERKLMPAGTLPEIVFFGHHRDLAVVGETVIEGESFEARSRFDATCPYGKAAVDWLIDLSASTVVEQPPVDLAGAFQQLLDRFCEIYTPSPEHQVYLNGLVARLRQTPPPAVFQHGDPGSWNLLVTAANQVAFLDWENAIEHGVPLWDLFYFLRSYCVAAGQKSGNFGVLPAIEHFMLEQSPLSGFIVDALERYCRRVELDTKLVEPLFFMCWIFWAVKQAALVETIGLQTAHYVQLIKLCIERRDAPTLARIFALEVS